MPITYKVTNKKCSNIIEMFEQYILLKLYKTKINVCNIGIILNIILL